MGPAVEIKELINREKAEVYASRMDEYSEYAANDFHVEKSGSYSNLYVDLMLDLLPTVEETVGKELLPTYCYSRIYYNGAVLDPHTDRPEAEISITMNLRNVAEPWDIMMHDDDKNVNVYTLEPGDALIYSGYDYTHWRRKNLNAEVYQLFMHYVVKDGPFADRAYEYKTKEYERTPNLYKLLGEDYGRKK